MPSAVALLTFSQGLRVGSPGQALIVVDGAPVTITNAGNSGVQSFLIELLYAPPSSSQQITPGT